MRANDVNRLAGLTFFRDDRRLEAICDAASISVTAMRKRAIEIEGDPTQMARKTR